MDIIWSLILTGVLVWLLYKYGTNTFDYWPSRGVFQIETYPFIGTGLDLVLGRVSEAEDILIQYRKMKGNRFGGLYFFRQPAIMLTDPDLIKQITIKDFDHFTDRVIPVPEDVDPLFGKSLLAVQGQRWKEIRNVLSPAFTSSKMKNMFGLINDCGAQVSNYVEEKLGEDEKGCFKGDLKELIFSKFTNDVIASAAFGLQVDSFKHPNNEFYKYTKQAVNFTGVRFFAAILFAAIPQVMKLFGATLFGSACQNFYNSIVKETIRVRKEKKLVRQDMIHLLMLARDGALDDNEAERKKWKQVDLTDEDITSQAFLFIFAGFDTSSVLISFAAHELAMNQDIQDKLFEEITRVVDEDNGNVTYDGVINKMKYLDMVISETLRKWPPVPLVDRTVTKPYVIPGLHGEPDLLLEKGIQVQIPVAGIHADPVFWPQPEIFDPERFSEQNKLNIKQGTYMPFGIGPRNCIGNRFALMECKILLVHLLTKYQFVVVEETMIPIVLKKGSLVMEPEKGFQLGIRPRPK